MSNAAQANFFNSTRMIGCCFLVLASSGCRIRVGGETTVEAENMRLRQENRALIRAAESSELARAEAESKLAQTVGGTSGDARAANIMAAIPRLTRIVISENSCIDRNGVARVFVEAQDGRARAMQVVGELTVTIAQGDRELATRTYAPLELREAYRTGPFGAHYLVEFQLNERPESAVLRMKFTELPVTRVFVVEEKALGVRP
ncbi:MAG: hypothetical protein ACK54H_01900 [Phycisphaerales bacterium]